MLYVRPILEYAAVVWAPNTKCDTERLEVVQRHAIRFVMSNYNCTTSITAMLSDLIVGILCAVEDKHLDYVCCTKSYTYKRIRSQIHLTTIQNRYIQVFQ